jgi:hypothetical protein
LVIVFNRLKAEQAASAFLHILAGKAPDLNRSLPHAFTDRG